MSNSWDNKKVHCIGKYNIYSIKGSHEDPMRWYTEIHSYTKDGERYSASFGSNAPTRLLAAWYSLVRYWWGG